MWIIYALSASVIWGISYATSGRVIARGMSPLVFFFFYALFGAFAAGVALTLTGKVGAITAEVKGLNADWGWFLLAVGASAAGTLLIYMAIGEKNATLASLIEISYPFFVAIFSWLLFRDIQFNTSTILGGLLIIGGVAVVYLGNRS